MGRILRAVAAIAATAALFCAAAGSARADVYDDNPAAAALGPGNIWLFARAADGTILAKHGDGTTWGDWTSIGGSATSGPAATIYNGQVQVYVRGADGAIWEDVLVENGWTGWFSIGGSSTSAPAVSVRRGINYLDLAYRGVDNAIWFRSYVPGSGWSPPSSLAGNLSSAPTVASYADGVVHLYARGTDQAVYERAWTGSQWTDWASFGGVVLSAPADFSRTPGALNIYVRGGGNQTYADVWNGSAWSGWILMDTTPIDSTPVPYSDDPGREALVARKGNDLLLKQWTAAAGWGTWTDLGAIAVPAPPAPAPPAAPPATTDELRLLAGVACTPAGSRVRVSVGVKRKKGSSKPRVTKIVFYTKGKGRAVQVDSRAPFLVHLKVNAPAGSSGRVYARVYFRRSKHGKLHHKIVSRRFSVCR